MHTTGTAQDIRNAFNAYGVTFSELCFVTVTATGPLLDTKIETGAVELDILDGALEQIDMYKQSFTCVNEENGAVIGIYCATDTHFICLATNIKDACLTYIRAKQADSNIL